MDSSLCTGLFFCTLFVSLGAVGLSLRAYQIARKDALGSGTVSERLAQITDEAFLRMQEVMRSHGMKTSSWEYKFRQAGGDIIDQSTIVACSKCGRKNRLRDGLDGARCADCKHSFAGLRN